MNQPKKVLKSEIKFQITPTPEQKLVKAGAYDKDVSIVLGDFGSGKTQIAALTALDLLFKGHVKKIYITRPLDFSATGYIKGSMDDKMHFHVFPVKQCFYSAYNKQKIDELFTEGVIQIVPIDYLKGWTVSDAVFICDEFEDITFKEFKLILSRLGKDSKLFFTGSAEQINIKNSCISEAQILEACPDVNYHVLSSQHRNDSILKILDFIENAQKEKL